MEEEKKQIDRKISGPFEQSDLDLWSFKVLSDASWEQLIQEQYPEEVSSSVFIKTTETTEAFLRNKMHDAVVTLSAHFSAVQRQAIKDN